MSEPTQPLTGQELLEKYGNLTKENFTHEALDEIIRAVFAMLEGLDAILSAMQKIKPAIFEEAHKIEGRPSIETTMHLLLGAS